VDDKRRAGLDVTICGDWNTAHHDIDLKNYKTNRKTSGFTAPERALIDEYVEAGWLDSFRTLNPDLGDRYTWWSNRAGVRARNVGWRIDYHFVDRALWPKVKDAVIHDGWQGSDHCPIELILSDGPVR
ncbi:MAG: exodeoxyribonuclease III, partial [Myxococcota bacterium]|nr:exodeoxyribonuclease III [Myxococcota bacterium]